MTWTNLLMAWYQINKRPFPWRKSRDPYKIWLSEIILQQTRIAQGTPFYISFIDAFPTVNDLAAAEEQQVLKLWQGLGLLFSRQKFTSYGSSHCFGLRFCFPATLLQSCSSLKGVGNYTASAISSICFDEPQAVVDGNVYRVLARYFGKDTPIDASYALKEFQSLGFGINGHGEFRAILIKRLWSLGPLQCTPKTPSCDTLPVSNRIVWRFNQSLIESAALSRKDKIKVILRGTLIISSLLLLSRKQPF